jgi:hypothetical protein
MVIETSSFSAKRSYLSWDIFPFSISFKYDLDNSVILAKPNERSLFVRLLELSPKINLIYSFSIFIFQRYGKIKMTKKERSKFNHFINNFATLKSFSPKKIKFLLKELHKIIRFTRNNLILVFFE